MSGLAEAPLAAAGSTWRQWLAAAAAFALATSAAVVLAGGSGASRGSTISRGPGGWLAARRYLQARGARVTLIAEPLARYVQRELAQPAAPGSDEGPGRLPAAGSRAPGPGVLALVFPWQSIAAVGLDEAIEAHLGRGGDLVLAYSGEEAGAERLLDLWRSRTVGKAPLAPWRWRAFMRRVWQLQPADRLAPAPPRPLRVWAPRALPELGAGARVLFTGPAGQPAVAVFRHHRGRVVLLPADALSNSRLGEAGNADLLETLLRNLGPRWAFDEYHHGLVAAGAPSGGLGRTADLLLAHLVLLYLLAVLALARRQGPAWREPQRIAGSAATFLLGLGALHHRLGHHHEAALLLLRRARELDRGLELPPALDRQAANAGPGELIEIARQVARRRAGHPVAEPGEPR